MLLHKEPNTFYWSETGKHATFFGDWPQAAGLRIAPGTRGGGNSAQQQGMQGGLAQMRKSRRSNEIRGSRPRRLGCRARKPGACRNLLVPSRACGSATEPTAVGVATEAHSNVLDANDRSKPTVKPCWE